MYVLLFSFGAQCVLHAAVAVGVTLAHFPANPQLGLMLTMFPCICLQVSACYLVLAQTTKHSSSHQQQMMVLQLMSGMYSSAFSSSSSSSSSSCPTTC
ncbi:hypothetical protein COO60DRAFT_864532 [Scenedesmus sp. NREL 46B-D3]|nr:hypothetical protein COO60DRAFT_864532 [Scenedesmus sp. NREL 46B-D3]